MELIVRNQETIVNWYRKEAKKDGIRPLVLPAGYSLDCVTRTEWVKPEIVEEITEMGIGISPPQKIKIVPLMFRNNCHYNSSKLCQIANKKDKKLRHLVGYNFHSCPCGRFYSMEIHSVVQDIATGEMMDFTEDFAGETEKWFIPVIEVNNENSGSNYFNVISFVKNEIGAEFYYNRDEEHLCRIPNGKKIGWRPPIYATYKGSSDRKEFAEVVMSLKNINFR